MMRRKRLQFIVTAVSMCSLHTGENRWNTRALCVNTFGQSGGVLLPWMAAAHGDTSG